MQKKNLNTFMCDRIILGDRKYMWMIKMVKIGSQKLDHKLYKICLYSCCGMRTELNTELCVSMLFACSQSSGTCRLNKKIILIAEALDISSVL